MSTETDAAIREADEWLAEHRVTESWRVINRLRDTLVRLAERDRQVAEQAWDETVRALAWAMDNGPDPLTYVREHNPYRADSAAPARPTTDDREALAELAFLTDRARDSSAASPHDIARAHDAIAAALASRPTTPTPTVSEADVERAARWLRESWGKSPAGRNNFVATNALAITRNLISALGLTVTDGGEG